MGLTCSLHRASEAEIKRLLAEPDAIAGFLYPEDGSLQVRKVWPRGVLGWLLRLTPITIEEVVPDSNGGAAIHPPDPDRSIDIDRGWHGLHFLFTGTADEGDEPACYFVRGGQDLDDEGHARALRPDQVRRFAVYLDTLTPAELARRYDPARMTELDIYPGVIWTRPSAPDESPLAWLTGCYAEVQQFVKKVAASGEGLIINIS
ncbi:YfbM family protein [Mesorhizobium amorphae]|uniref:YfbM family protein n=1 Tax=Mesorhizobium amorphae TaxID=71433 RepID=UPI003ECE035F